MPTFPRRLLVLLLLSLPTWLPASAQVAYTVEVDAGEKVWRVEGELANPGGKDLDYWIARWTPGAYHPADFGRAVEDFEARSAAGKELAVERVGDSCFRIRADGAESLRIAYRAASLSDPESGGPFSNNVIDVEANRITRDYAYLTPVSLLGFVAGRLAEPYRVRFRLPRGWSTATVLEEEDGEYVAPSFQRLEDSPFLFSPELVSRTFQVEDTEVTVSSHGFPKARLDGLVEGCEKIVRAAGQFFGGLPFDRYEFLLGFVPGSAGSGLEHTFSTLILASPSMSLESHELWGLVAHELVHAWCAERIRVEAVHDPDYTQVLDTGTIWFNEGVTEYVTQHVLLHAGFLDEDGFLEALAGPLPFPPQAMDQFFQGASWTDISRATADWESLNDLMTFALRSYILGRRTIFALDLEMRRASNGERGVADLLRLLMREYVAEDRGFREGEMMDLVERVAGANLDWFYERYIDGPDLPDLGDSLDVIGYRAEDRGAREVDRPSPEQLAARKDLFSIP